MHIYHRSIGSHQLIGCLSENPCSGHAGSMVLAYPEVWGCLGQFSPSTFSLPSPIKFFHTFSYNPSSLYFSSSLFPLIFFPILIFQPSSIPYINLYNKYLCVCYVHYYFVAIKWLIDGYIISFSVLDLSGRGELTPLWFLSHPTPKFSLTPLV